jgi:hypothetical protein
MAFVASAEDGVRRLFVRSLESGETRSLSGTVDAQYPFWSPDSCFIGFFSQKKLRRIDAAGGPAQAICDSKQGGGGTWGPDGTILFAPGPGGVIDEVPASGGTPGPPPRSTRSGARRAIAFPSSSRTVATSSSSRLSPTGSRTRRKAASRSSEPSAARWRRR